jgi:hypothetical protein
MDLKYSDYLLIKLVFMVMIFGVIIAAIALVIFAAIQIAAIALGASSFAGICYGGGVACKNYALSLKQNVFDSNR